ncbi:MAG TPA: hypothetical protein VMJ70_15650 [Candidatus Sulfotelmatobacter sp.]|nr:hypothetical protein [Candidatus Sulfotelmatobacter sp.]
MNRNALLLAGAFMLLAGSAHAENWSIGSNLGLSDLHPKHGGDALVVFGAPSSPGVIVPTFQPGLRLGASSKGGEFETYFDTGLTVFSSSSSTVTGYQLTANLQYNFGARSSTNPFLTFGGGVMGQSYSEGNNNSNPIWGGGLGVRQRVAGNHGDVRVEFRYDSISEDKQGFEGGTLYGVKIGFDLWMR